MAQIKSMLGFPVQVGGRARLRCNLNKIGKVVQTVMATRRYASEIEDNSRLTGMTDFLSIFVDLNGAKP